MEKSKIHQTQLIFFICLSIGYQTNPFGIKKVCLVTFITAASYMLYNDYRYTVASYQAYKTERSVDQLLTDLATKKELPSPDPGWLIAQHKQIENLKKSALEYQNRSLLSRLLPLLYNRCKQCK